MNAGSCGRKSRRRLRCSSGFDALLRLEFVTDWKRRVQSGICPLKYLIESLRTGVALANAIQTPNGNCFACRFGAVRSTSRVSVRPSHLELTSPISQDRVHVNNRAHNAQRLRDFNTFRPTHPPDLYAAIQSRTGGRVPASWGLHRGIGGAAWNECQCSAPLAQRTPAQWMPSTG